MKTSRCLLALLAGLLFATAGSAARTVVAKVKVQNPADEPMADVIVRGALPLPLDFDKPPAGG